MSLKTRVRVSIITPVIVAVIILLTLNIREYVDTKFQDLLERANGVARQVNGFLLDNLPKEVRLRKFRTRNPEEVKQAYYEIVRGDPAITSLLHNAMVTSADLVEVKIVADDGIVLASSNPANLGESATAYPDITEWKQKGLLDKLVEINQAPRNYEVRIQIGLAAQNSPLFTVKAVVSAPLLEKSLKPELRKLFMVSGLALGISLVLAFLVSNLAVAPLSRIGQTIDRIARGELDPLPPPSLKESKELAVVQSKLNVLGEQFRGAKKDALQLRSGIEQLLEKLETAVLLFDQNGHLIVAGKAAQRVLGQDRNELVGRTLEEVFPPAAAMVETLKAAIELRRPVHDVSFEWQPPGGPAAQLLISCEVLVSFSSGQQIGTLVTLRDAEPRRQIESHLEVATRLAAISRLTGGVAHEIKNPLNAIALHLEVLRSKLDGESEQQSEIDIIAREITRLDRVVKTFLDFNRPVDLKLEEIDLAALLEEVHNLVGVQAARYRAVVEMQSDVHSAPLRADRDLLKQAVLNVVMNGLEAMKSGGTLRIHLSRSGNEHVVSVADQGVGIPPGVRDKVFNLYFSTKQKGSGIGLAMTFRVVQLHGGTIDFTSEPGKGTTFWFRFPVLERENIPAVEEATVRHESA